MIRHLLDVIKSKAPMRARRSSKWTEFRANFLRMNPTCAVCGGTEKLEVHHIIPFHEAPARELDALNVIVLCESWKGGLCCHLAVGHGGNYRKINPNVRRDAEYLAGMLKGSG